ncbi:homoserine dehydrogenase [Sulfodiicoccus acidiphilus]|uniref:Homoserine dehydrogenase n=1 Tax=Sulfodiicoccus acidiphilus TaxID=1670455 RepID=A0A348B0L1_9CREN|nr:homoserine dehydrogenase [Sulfodiicoccus acidiphilus]BBD71713.1 homoserine dehydrogenase [Sulfodiicoccus acidiphilus]GGT86414.1 homoserine dehydrogenase [Sulfodiicoccus acidiphilus]
MKVLLLGYGNVGKAFVELLRENQLNVKVVGAFKRGGLVAPLGGEEKAVEIEKGLEQLSPDVLVDVSSPNYVNGEPSVSAYLEAFKRGIHVITANKAPLALKFGEILDEARKRKASLGFQATVMSGVPSVNLRRVLPALKVYELRGILNGTTNYILSKMHDGLSFDQALKEAQEQGFAEPDPTLDVNGFDSAAKLTILANVYFGCRKSIKDVRFSGIEHIDFSEVGRWRNEGLKPKLVAKASRSELRVSVEALTRNDPLYHVDGVTNGLLIRTDIQDIFISGPGAGPKRAAYGILSDLLIISSGQSIEF